MAKLLARFRWWLLSKGWPSYECEQCVGQEYYHGCYCAYYGAWCPAGPKDGTEPFSVWAGRWLYRKLYGEPYPRG